MNYPSIAFHLLPFKDKAITRSDKGDFWWELRACEYYDEFNRPKIIYLVFQVKPAFTFDEEGFLGNNATWIIPTEDKVLLAILNSKLGWYLISQFCTSIQNGYQLIYKYLGQLPIATPDDETKASITSLVEQILSIKQDDAAADTSALEAEIDVLVYRLYGLSYEEVLLVEPEFALPREAYEVQELAR